MHQTTIRFDSQLWQRIETQSARAGVSAAQYIRDATLIRLTHGTGSAEPATIAPDDGLRRDASLALERSDSVGMDSRAVWAQARQARERARSLRAASHVLAEARALRPWAGSKWSQDADGSRLGS